MNTKLFFFSDGSYRSFFLTSIRTSHSVMPSSNIVICAVQSFLNEGGVKIWVVTLPSMIILIVSCFDHTWRWNRALDSPRSFLQWVKVI